MAVVERGFLLVASPSLRDENFARTVSLVCSHGSQGTYGLVLNRPSGTTLGAVLPEVAEALAGVPVHYGGPVQREVLQLLQDETLGGERVLAGVALGAGLEGLREAAPERDPARVGRAYLGYAGWDGGQLEAEIREGAWFVTAATAQHVFAVPPDELWERVLGDMGGKYAWGGLVPDDPSAN